MSTSRCAAASGGPALLGVSSALQRKPSDEGNPSSARLNAGSRVRSGRATKRAAVVWSEQTLTRLSRTPRAATACITRSVRSTSSTRSVDDTVSVPAWIFAVTVAGSPCTTSRHRTPEWLHQATAPRKALGGMMGGDIGPLTARLRIRCRTTHPTGDLHVPPRRLRSTPPRSLISTYRGPSQPQGRKTESTATSHGAQLARHGE